MIRDVLAKLLLLETDQLPEKKSEEKKSEEKKSEEKKSEEKKSQWEKDTRGLDDKRKDGALGEAKTSFKVLTYSDGNSTATIRPHRGKWLVSIPEKDIEEIVSSLMRADEFLEGYGYKEVQQEGTTRKQKDAAVRQWFSHDPEAGEQVLAMGKKDRAEQKSFNSAKREIDRLKKTNEGAKVDRMVGHIKSSEKRLGKSDKDAESIAWATANKRGMLDNVNKRTDEDSIDNNWKKNWETADQHPMNDKELRKKYDVYVDQQNRAHRPHISWGSWALQNARKTESVSEGKTMYDIKKGLQILTEGVVFEAGNETLKHVLNRFKAEVKAFQESGDLDDDLYEALYDYYADAGEMPYGTMKARTGDPYEWVGDRLSQELSLGLNGDYASMDPSDADMVGDVDGPLPMENGPQLAPPPEEVNIDPALLQDDSIQPDIQPGEEIVTEGLEGKITQVLSDVGLDEGYDFFFENGLVVIGRSTARVVINALRSSGQFTAEPTIESMDGEEVRIKFGPRTSVEEPTTDMVNDLAAEPELEEDIASARKVNFNSLEVDGVERWDYPDFADAYLSYGEWETGTPMTSEELEAFELDNPDIVHELAHGNVIDQVAAQADSMHEGKDMKTKVNESISVNITAQDDDALDVIKALSGLGQNQISVQQTSGEMSPMSAVATPCATDQMKSFAGLFSEAKEPERSADREDDDDDTNSDEEDDLAESKQDRKDRGDETYENTPDEKTAGLEAAIPTGDDMHKKKGANPNWQGDNAMRTRQFESKDGSPLEESLWEEYNAIKQSVDEGKSPFGNKCAGPFTDKSTAERKAQQISKEHGVKRHVSLTPDGKYIVVKKVAEGKIDDLKDKQAAEKDNDWWGAKSKGDQKSPVKKVSGKAYGGSAQKDAEEKDDNAAPKKRGRPAKK